MPQKIENKDIFSPDFLEPQKKSFKELLDLIKNIEAELKDVLKVQQEMVKTSDKKSVEGLKARQQAIKTVGVASKELMNLEKQRIGVEEKSKIASQKVAQQIQKTSQQQLKTKQQKLKLDKEILNAEKALNQAIQQEKKAIQQGLKVQQEELKIKRQKLSIEIQEKKELQRLDNIKQKEIATAKKLATAAAKENSEYLKQSKRLNELKRKYQDLILVQGKETRESRKLLREVTRLDTKLKKVDASVGNFQRSVGNYGKAFGKVTGVLRNFGLAVGGAAIARNIIGIFSGFQNEAANLASVLGKTRKEITLLSDDAKRLGSSTRFTAKEVLKLQTEFAKLGFKEQEILDATEATLSLAAATGTELSEAAAVAGATLGGFGLGAEETQRIVDVMAKSFSTSALDMEKFKESMKGAAPAARAIGLSVEKTTALLGTLASAGISGSKAGNNLKTSFINLNKAGLTLEEGLAKVAKSEDKLSAASNLVGKNAAASFLVLAEGVETTKELEEGLNDAGGAAQKMADEQLDTLSGQTSLLTSAWEGFILSLEDGNGIIARVMRKAIKLTTEFLDVLTKLSLTTEQYNSKQARELAGIATKSQIKKVKELNGLYKKSNKELEELGKKDVNARTVLKLRLQGVTDLNSKLIISQYWATIYNERVAKSVKIQDDLNKNKEDTVEWEEKSKEAQLEIAGFTARSEVRQKEINKLLKNSTEEELKYWTAKKGTNKQFTEIVKLANEELQRRKDVGELQEESLTTGEKTTKETAKQNEELKKQNELLKKRLQLKKDAFDATQTIGEQEQEQLKEIIKLQEIAAEKELQIQLEIAASKPEEVNVDELEMLLNERFNLIKRALEDERDLMLLNEDLTAEERELINIKFNNKLAANERNRVKTVDDANNEIIEAQIETSEKVAEIQTDGNEKVLDNDKKLQEQRLTALRSFSQKAIEIADAKTDKEIENIDKEIDASKTRQDELQTLAAQGNLTAEQSVGAEIKRQADLERQKEALEKKKARRQIILEGLDLLSSKIDNGDKDAVTSTLNDMTRLLGALSALPGFIDGTETTVGAALGKPQLNTGTDDYIVRVDGSEKILNPGMSARTGNMTTEEITRAAEMYSSGMFDQNVLIHPQINALNQPFQNSNEILKKFDSLESTIRNKPILSDLKFDDLQKALIVTVEQNGDLKRAHYKLK